MKSTGDLIDQLKNRNKKDLDFLKDKDFKCPEMRYYLADLLRTHKMTSAEYIEKMNLDRSYGYQLLNGRRKPSRELLIRTAILFELNLEETQRLLKIGNREVLYPRVRKDAIAVFVIEKGLPLSEYQELVETYEKGI
ncbi:MAG: helix-turn-helix domain-containing protein [Suilimivivens sp.]